jgi:tetratricopeptide (TPR) repeat protein
MPTRHYMDVDPRHDHSIRVPRPDLSVALGVPNACTGCHADAKRLPSELADKVPRYQDWQRLAEQGQAEVIAELQRVDRWAADLVDTWRNRQGKPAYPAHFGEHLQPIWLAARGDAKPASPTERQALLKWATDRTASPMYRVTAWSEVSQWLDADSLQAALTTLGDSDPFVVNQALQRIEQEILRLLEYTSYGWPAPQCQSEVQRLSGPVVELLSHDTRLVRIRAAAVLLQLPPAWRSELLGSQQRRWEQALDEALAVHLLNEEMASVANIYELLGQRARAEEYYRLALQHSPAVYGIRSNLATLLEQKPGTDPQATRELVARLRGQDQQLLETELQRAGHLPAAGPLHYRYAMTQYLLGNLELVEKHLLEALARRPQEPMFLLAAATYFQAAGDRQSAAQHVATLRQLDPRHPGYLALEREILSNNTP